MINLLRTLVLQSQKSLKSFPGLGTLIFYFIIFFSHLTKPGVTLDWTRARPKSSTTHRFAFEVDGTFIDSVFEPAIWWVSIQLLLIFAMDSSWATDGNPVGMWAFLFSSLSFKLMYSFSHCRCLLIVEHYWFWMLDGCVFYLPIVVCTPHINNCILYVTHNICLYHWSFWSRMWMTTLGPIAYYKQHF